MRRAFFVVFCLILGVFNEPSFAQVASQEVPETPKLFRHQGIERKYLEYLPKNAPAGPRPLFIHLHGLRPADWKMRRWPELEHLSEREGFVALTPEAVQFRWNYASAEAMQSAPVKVGDTPIDDVGFLVALIEDRIAARIADPARIYVTGDSRGGIMAFEMMCRASGKITAAGPFIASMMEKQLEQCRPDRPVPVIAINGTMDDNIPYDGIIREGKRQLSAPEVMEFWRKQHGCSGQNHEAVPKREGAQGDRTSLWRITWTGCKQEGGVVLYRVNNGGHYVPSLVQPRPEQRGRRNHDISGIEEFWKFASKFQR